MEPSSIRIDRTPLLAQGTPRLRDGLMDPLREIIREAGLFGLFLTGVLRAVPGSLRYSSEILRQAGILIAGSAAVIWGMQFVIGMQVGTEAASILRGYGAQSYTGVFTAWATVRVTAALMFGYILAAKVGCGLVAEIGSMRLHEEIDAMQTMGVDPMKYLLAPRLVAAAIVMPFIYVIGLAVQFVAEYVTVVLLVGEVSRGAWEQVHWQYQNPLDLTYSLGVGMVFALTIVVVGLFYGYRASGGPAGVGAATAKSMVVNLVLVHLLGALAAMALWGFTPNAPVGG